MSAQTDPLTFPRPSAALQYAALFLAVALAFLGNGLQGTLTGIRASQEGLSSLAIGLIMSSFFLGYFAGSIVAPRLIRQVGHIRAFAALASIASGVTLAFPIFISPGAWIVFRLIGGACFAGMLIVVESWLNAGSSSAVRGRVLAAYNLVVYVAWGASQQLLNLAPAAGFTLFCVVSILFSLSLVPVTLSRAGQPGVVKAERSALRRLAEVSPTAVAGTFCLGAAMAAFWGMAPSWGEGQGLSESTLAAFLSIVLVGALALQWPLGWLSDLLDRRLVLTVALLAGAGVAAALYVKGAGGGLPLYALGFLLGASAMPGYALCVAHANDQIASEEVVTVSSGLILLYGAGSAVGPLSASLVMTQFGPDSLHLAVAAWLVLPAAYAALRALRGPEGLPRPEKTGYVSVLPQTSHPSMSMHSKGTGEPEEEPAPR